MNAPTLFQLQYPLSPKKFWKKIIPQLFSTVFLVVLALVILIPTFLAIQNDGQSSFDAPISSISLGAAIGIPLIIILVFAGGGMILYAWYIRAYIRRYYYDANDNFVSIQKGVFTPTEIHVQYSKIQDVYVDQDLLDRMLGIYDVHIASATATSGIEAHIDGVDAHVAEASKNLILNKIQGHASNSVGIEQSLPAPVPEQTVSIDGEVSSRTYPIDPRYLQQYLLSSIASVGIWSIVLYLAVSRLYSVVMHGESSPIALPLVGYFLIVLAFRVFGFIYNIFWIQNFYFSFEPEYIVVRKGIIAKEERHVPYRTIQDVTLSQGISDRLFGLCTVYIENATNLGGAVASSSAAVTIPGLRLAHGQDLVRIVNQITKLRNDHARTGL